VIINKFGGEIMGGPRLVKLAVLQIKSQLRCGQKPVVVVSALSGVTDKLVELCKKYDQRLIDALCREHEEWRDKLKVKSEKLKVQVKSLKLTLEKDARSIKGMQAKEMVQDRVLAYGEKLSSLLFTELLRQNGIKAVRLTGEEIGVITDDNFGDANVDYKRSVRNIRQIMQKSKIKNQNVIQNAKFKSSYLVPVITGFVGKTSRGQTTTLGRGGSDTTACLVGAALRASKVILWKNVPGVLTADPKVVKDVRTIKSLSYEKAENIGKVIHHKSMDFARRAGMAVEVTYIQNPRYKTVIYAKN
jgi:aspartate kinase